MTRVPALVAIAAIIALLIFGMFTSIYAVLLFGVVVAAFAGLWGWRAAIRERG